MDSLTNYQSNALLSTIGRNEQYTNQMNSLSISDYMTSNQMNSLTISDSMTHQ